MLGKKTLSNLLSSQSSLFTKQYKLKSYSEQRNIKYFHTKNDKATLIKIGISSSLNYEMDLLRQVCFPGHKPIISSYDKFDDKSQHVVVKVGNKIAAYSRLTPGPNAVFEEWTKGRAKIPTEKHVMDLGRCLVKPAYRGLGLFEIVCLASLRHAHNLGYQYVVGAYIPGEKVGQKLHKIGFEISGGQVYEDEPGLSNVLVQPITCKLSKSQQLWLAMLKENKAFLKTKNYLLDIDEVEFIHPDNNSHEIKLI